MDTETYLKQLAEQQKANKKAELEQTKQEALTEISQEESKIVPTYAKQKQTANVQSQIAAKNFAEYLANRGQTSQGIATQYEMSRQNTLGNTLGGINEAENEAQQNIALAKQTTERDYTNSLTTARQAIDLDLQTNLYNEKLRQEELARQEAAALAKQQQQQQEALAKQQQQDFENQMAIAKYNLSVNKAKVSSSKSSSKSSTKQQVLKGILIPHDYAVANQLQGVPINSTTNRWQVGDVYVDVPKGTNPFTGTTNKDLYNDKGKLDLSKAFGNTYQPNNVGGIKLANTGTKINYNGQNINVFKTTNTKTDKGAWWNPFDTKEVETNKYYFWDGSANKYITLNSAEKKALGLK